MGNRLGASFLVRIGNTVAISLIQIVYIVFTVRLLDPTAFGQAMLVVAYLGILTALLEFGSVSYVVAKRDEVLLHYISSHTFVLGLLVLLPSVAYLHLAVKLSLWVSLAIVGVFLVLKSLTTYVDAVLLYRNDIKTISLIELLSVSIGNLVLVPVLVVYFKLGWQAVVAGFLVQMLIKSLYLVRRPPGKMVVFSLSRSKQFLKSSGYYGINNIINAFSEQVISIIIGLVLSPTALGIFNRAYQFLTIPSKMIGTALGFVLFPSLAVSDRAQRRELMNFSYGFSFKISLILSLLMVVNTRWVVDVVFPSSWAGIEQYAYVFAAAIFFRLTQRVFDSYVKAEDLVSQRIRIQIFLVVALVVALLLLAPLGLLAVTVLLVFYNVANWLVLWQITAQHGAGIQILDRSKGMFLIKNVLVCILMFVLKEEFHFSSVVFGIVATVAVLGINALELYAVLKNMRRKQGVAHA